MREDDKAELTVESGEDAKPTSSTYKSVNDYYGHKIGFYQTLSLFLNALLMVYAQVGQSGIVLSSLNPNLASSDVQFISTNNATEGSCNAQDQIIWKENGGDASLAPQGDYCARTYNGGCILNITCSEVCFQELYGYSSNCTSCMGQIFPCGIGKGCALACIADGTAPECIECLSPCFDIFYLCTGLPAEEFSVKNVSATEVAVASSPDGDLDVTAAYSENNQCNKYNSDDVENWYTVYNLTYGKSIRDAWKGGAKFLAIVIVLFSGIWPYVKNIILVIVWYKPMSVNSQTSILLWLSRLSKYTLVDVFAVIGVLVGVQLQLNLGGIEVVTRAEPRFGIIAFFLATLWEFFQIELIKVMHERKVLGEEEADSLVRGDRSALARLWILALILLATIALFVVGAISEFISIESSNDSGGVCLKSYNLVSVGNALINELSLAGNVSPGHTWFLYLVYVLLVLAFPVLTHMMQIIFVVVSFQSKTLKHLIKWASAISCFASVEVLLLGTFAVESKFEDFIKSIAGDENADLIDIKSGLGSGFYILIPYCIVGSLLQMHLSQRHNVPPIASVVTPREKADDEDCGISVAKGTATETFNTEMENGRCQAKSEEEIETVLQE